MRTTFVKMLIALMIMISFVSCNNEELFVESNTAAQVTDQTEETVEPEAEIVDASTPCDFALANVQPNSTLTINCVLDLQGKTISLPSSVTVDYQGGQIINGTINFSENGIIDGDLLNSTLIISGLSLKLKEPVFNFHPQRWGIVEGIVSDEVAKSNRDILNSLFKTTQNLDANTFKIDKMDAYFDVQINLNNPEAMAMESILLPSNFNLIMSNDTHLRVQTNGMPSYILMGVFKGKNISVTGGNLYGDRWEHDYSPINDIKGRPRDGHEWGNVLHVVGGKNIIFDGVNIYDAIGDGFSVYNSTIRNPDGSVRDGEMISENVIIRNSIIKSSRRNGMSLLDGNGILIENCQIKDTAVGETASGEGYSSAGTWPKQGISFEAYRERTEDGQLLEYNRIENVIVRGSSFTNNIGGDINLFTCSNITIEDNYMDSMITNIAANTIIIRNNTMKARIKADGTPWGYALLLISRIGEWDGEFNYDYTIYGNTIEGYTNGMILGGLNYKVFNNTVRNCKAAVVFGKLNSSKLYGNNIFSDIQYSTGYRSNDAELNDVTVTDENIEVDYRPINFRNLITENANAPFTFTNSSMISITENDNFIENSRNISITENVINTDFTVNNSENIIISDNTSN